jgi:hypothetical protein
VLDRSLAGRLAEVDVLRRGVEPGGDVPDFVGGSLAAEVRRKRALEQFLRVGKHVLVEVSAAQIVQRLRQFEIRPRAAALEDCDRRLQGIFRIAKAPGVAVEIAELREQDSGDPVVRTEPGPRHRDCLFGKRNGLRLLPRLVEVDDLLVEGRKLALLGVGVLDLKRQQCNDEDPDRD